jgi:apolipoprotein D and lipocalin family protein
MECRARLRTPARWAGLLAVSLGLWSCASPAPLPTVDAVDLQRYTGDWYEIAKLPNLFQSACATDTVARYGVAGDGVSVRNRCRRADGTIASIDGRASVVAGSSGARLEVTFFWPFRGDYWILARDPSYQWVLVGEPRRRYAWVLSRSPRMEDDALSAILARAQALGFDAKAFERTPQRQALPEPDATVPRRAP